MSNWNISGGADDTITNGLPTNADNDQGTIRAGGNIAETTKFSADSISLGRPRFVTLVSGTPGSNQAVGPGTFNGGDQVIKRVTTDIAGVSNTTMQSGGSNSANRPFSINQITKVASYQYKTAVRSDGWDEFNGEFSPAVSMAESGVYDIAGGVDTSTTVSVSGTDNAANPSATNPGELTYRDGSPTPTNDTYATKSLF